MKKNNVIHLKNKFKEVLEKIADKPAFSSIMSSVISVIIGLLFGLILLLILEPSRAGWGLNKILFTGITDLTKLGKVLYIAAPILMTGLAVGIAFKSGLFNIGASGQYTLGAFFALFTAIVWQWPWYGSLVAAMLGGAIWGALPGIFKAFFNVHEVISSIMFNWIGLFFVNLLAINTPEMLDRSVGNRTIMLFSANKDAIIPKIGLDKLFNSNFMNISIFLAIGIAIIMYIALNKTKFGYELKACGYNRNASQNAGINAKRNIIMAMVISGAMAGIGGGLYYLSGIGQYLVEKNLLMAGFNGIPVALLGASNPVGIIFSALFISYIQVGGDALQPTFAKETIDVIISVIIYMSALSLIVKGGITLILKKVAKNKANREAKE